MKPSEFIQCVSILECQTLSDASGTAEKRTKVSVKYARREESFFITGTKSTFGYWPELELISSLKAKIRWFRFGLLCFHSLIHLSFLLFSTSAREVWSLVACVSFCL